MGYGTHARGGLVALAATVAALLAPGAASAQGPAPSSPDLIDRAEAAGRIDNERANLLRVYALKGDARLPAAYESDTPFDGTIELLKVRRELPRMEPGPERSAVAAALRAPPDPNPTNCDALSVTPLLNSVETTHFYVQYNEGAIGGGLDIDDYTASLETARATEVGAFGWAAPPVTALAQTDIGGKYHVRIDALGPLIYGFVSSQGTYAGPVGDNPNTAWDDEDADASCMALNQDFTGFPGSPQQALDATTAHEFNHSLQFGYGALSGDNVPDDNFVEGGATWMEDEVFDGANDNYNYLYPEFDDSMGEHDEGDIYAYWLTFRGITERFGANVPGGSEQVMQDFWEITSRNTGNNLTAMQQALAPRGRTLAETFHDYSIAARLMRPCGGGYVLPYCFEEATGYSDAAGGPPESHGDIATADGSHDGTIEDNYTINWVDLPEDGAYDITVSNTSAGGQLRATVACDIGAAVALASFAPPTVGGNEETTIPGFDPSSCASRPVLALTNETQTAPNPETSEERSYSVSTKSAPRTAAGPGSDSPVALLDTTAPVLQSLRLANRRFRAARAGRAISSARLGTRVRYSLSEAATVRARYLRRVAGRRVRGRCRAATNRNRSRRPCFRYVLLRGAARHNGQAGANSFRLTGRMNGRTLRPGVYRLRLTARDAARNTSRTRRSARFRIVRR